MSDVWNVNGKRVGTSAPNGLDDNNNIRKRIREDQNGIRPNANMDGHTNLVSSMMFEQDQMREQIQRLTGEVMLLRTQNAELQNSLNSAKPLVSSTVDFAQHGLPLKTVEEVNQFEMKLRDNSFRDLMVSVTSF